jgi:hypothetical protein
MSSILAAGFPSWPLSLHVFGAAEKAVLGRNRWVAKICRRAKFSPRFVCYGESLAETLSLIVSEHAVALVPDYVRQIPVSEGSANRRRRPGISLPSASADADWRAYGSSWEQRGERRVEVGQIIRTPARGMGILPMRTGRKR